MKTVGIRELKQRASQILRHVREEGISYEITYHGEPVARLIPIAPAAPADDAMAAVITQLDALAEEIDVAWPAGVSAVEAVRDIRR